MKNSAPAMVLLPVEASVRLAVTVGKVVPLAGFGLTPTPDVTGPMQSLTVIAKLGETVPSPQELFPLTVRLPDVAVAEKEIVIDELPLPVMVAPPPPYAQV